MTGWNVHSISRSLGAGPPRRMNPIVLSLTYLILLRVARIPLPPLVHVWSRFSIDELVDLHEVLARAVTLRDDACQLTCSVLHRCYDFRSLFDALGLLKGMWFNYLKRTRPEPLPVAILSPGDRLNSRMQAPPLLHFPDSELGQSWSYMCPKLLESVDTLSPDTSEKHDCVEQKLGCIFGDCMNRFNCFTSVVTECNCLLLYKDIDDYFISVPISFFVNVTDPLTCHCLTNNIRSRTDVAMAAETIPVECPP